MIRDLDSLDAFFYPLLDPWYWSADPGRRRTARTVVREAATEDSYGVEIDLPGVRSKDLEVKQEGNVIHVSGKRKGTEMSHKFAVPRGYDPSTASASLEDGVLSIAFERSPNSRPRLIPVGCGSGQENRQLST